MHPGLNALPAARNHAAGSTPPLGPREAFDRVALRRSLVVIFGLDWFSCGVHPVVCRVEPCRATRTADDTATRFGNGRGDVADRSYGNRVHKSGRRGHWGTYHNTSPQPHDFNSNLRLPCSNSRWKRYLFPSARLQM